MEKTLIVLGAGATKDIYKYFPTGIELIKEINSHLTIENKDPTKGGIGDHISDMTNQILGGLPHCKLEDIHLLKQHFWDYVRHHEYKHLRFDCKNQISIDYFIQDHIERGILNERSKEIAQYPFHIY